jgi:hypothetical protein
MFIISAILYIMKGTSLLFMPEGRDYETQWGEWIFSIYPILSAALSPGGLLSLQQKWVPEAET